MALFIFLSWRSVVSRGLRWVTFDCYGTLVDWQGGLGHLVAPIAGARASEVVEAFAGCQLALEKQGSIRSHKQVLKAALLCAAGERGVRLTDADGPALTDSWGALRAVV